MKIYKPVFIIGSYRGGTSLLFRLLSENKQLWSLYRESDHMWHPWFRHPDERADNVYMQASDLKIGDREYFDKHYHYSAYDNYVLGYLGRVKFLREGLPCILGLINAVNYFWRFMVVGSYRFIDKTPPNAYRVSYLEALYPDAKFIYLTRNKTDNVRSLMNAWNHKRKFKFPYRKYLTKNVKLNIEGYSGNVWKFNIPEDWQDYINKPLEQVCERQYEDLHEKARNALNKMDKSKWIEIGFENLLADPDTVIKQLCEFIDVKYSPEMQKIVKEMPLVNET